MNFGQLINLLTAEGIPLNSIIFKATWMENWYIPHGISGSGAGMRLDCTSPTRKDTARFDWAKYSNIKSHMVGEVTVVRGIGKLISRSGSKVRVVLHGHKHR